MRGAYARAMSYTKLNLRDAEDLAEKHGFGHIQEARFAWRALDRGQPGLSHQRIKPGQRGFPHKHRQAEEVYVVLAGSGRVKLDDEVEKVKLLDAIRVSPGVVRAFEAGDDGLELLAFGPRRENDAEMVRAPGCGDGCHAGARPRVPLPGRRPGRSRTARSAR